MLLACTVGGVLFVVDLYEDAKVRAHNHDAPVEAVREYLTAIAEGDAATANDLVDPAAFSKDIDPALLTNDVLSAAEDHIVIRAIGRVAEPDPGADTVEIGVLYAIPGTLPPDAARLRVQRTGIQDDGRETWRVLDPFLVPAVVGGTSGTTVTLGAVRIAATAADEDTMPVHYVYPANYALTADRSRYLAASGLSLRPSPLLGGHPSPEADPYVAQVEHTPTAALRKAINAKIADQVDACDAGRVAPESCPFALRPNPYLSVTVTENPTVDSIYPDLEKRRPAQGGMAFTVFAEGKMTMQGAGLYQPNRLTIMARVVVSPKDRLTFNFNEDAIRNMR